MVEYCLKILMYIEADDKDTARDLGWAEVKKMNYEANILEVTEN